MEEATLSVASIWTFIPTFRSSSTELISSILIWAPVVSISTPFTKTLPNPEIVPENLPVPLMPPPAKKLPNPPSPQDDASSRTITQTNNGLITFHATLSILNIIMLYLHIFFIVLIIQSKISPILLFSVLHHEQPD